MPCYDRRMHIQVIGGGSWGLALARLLALNGHEVSIWMRPEDEPDRVRAERESRRYLPGVRLPEFIAIADEPLAAPDLAVLAAPSHAMRAVAGRFRFPPSTVRVSVAKGIENDTLLRMSQVIAEAAPGGPVAALSGPSHAEEVGAGLPASVVAACPDAAAAELVQEAFFCDTFRVYTSPDIAGVELGGALKNVIAIAAGACDGLGFGDSAKAALIARGLAEMARLGIACGAEALTFAGLSGMGDLIATCASRHSRNRSAGERIARGESLESITSATPMVAEGIRTARSAHALGLRHGVELPITNEVHAVLFEGKDAREAVTSLMRRDMKPERA